MDTLFSAARGAAPGPLADATRPKTIDEIVGQEHILGAGKPLRRRMSVGRLGSVILYGPPGVGKTTIARAVGGAMKKRFEPMHGGNFAVKDLKKVVDDAQFNPTLLFIDEIHKLNSSQQDTLLEHAENGLFDLITATSKNPYHNLTNALVSRSTVFELRPLTAEQAGKVIDRGIEELGRRGTVVRAEPDARELLARKAGGDGRRALSALESAVIGRSGEVVLTADMVQEVLDAAPVTFDRDGDFHHDTVSAFVKSMRGGDPDATLYWLAALIHAGEDPRYIARRIVVHASEDVGLADNSALQTAVAAQAAVELIGLPECRITLAHAALHVCLSPKSNSAYRGINLAEQHVRANAIMPVPNYLRDTHYEGAAPLGRGGYASPHSTPEGWVDQAYAPGVPLGAFYQSDARGGGTFEARSDGFWENIKKRVTPRRWKAA
jgi:putative ATPase